MSKDNFHTLLSRYRNGTCSTHEKQLVEQWFALLDADMPPMSKPENEALEEKLWSAIQSRQQQQVIRPHWVKWSWAAAAIILLGFALWGVLPKSAKQPIALWDGLKTQAASSENHVIQTNTTTANLELKLPDGSRLELTPGSQIEYPKFFAKDHRTVKLKGKAFFDITRMVQRPFLVYSGEVITKVLGTSFWVDDGPDGQSIEVAVVTGKVSVSQLTKTVQPGSEKIKNGVILTANQRARFLPESHSFEMTIVENPLIVKPEGARSSAMTSSFLFEDAPMTEVIDRLEQAYGIEIILENEALEKCLFTAALPDQTLFTKLDLLCAAVNARYEVRGTRVLISGRGCL
ncbi:FecR family protein [Arundinibacter roseus]|uniref:FecR family protein n=1 Tax=Arundinibacter roseus TaxID=2070510 RepID=A0A4V6P8K7_9BACT|nr:FecR family protein [Arundinibacter roseus]TDB62705.1 FecR family protein [Arundinibacter roseus]